ncbi:hypothetical protein GTA62_09940 [Roseobacter sp. HKCCD9010]|uniref:hypothetical protein n=1 Tax=unclassified Roseobacter TaxID=196798 RepID=UPI00149098E8|nr:MULTISPECIES: hypothetical protein [unclassified Roseobacter]MBF9050971.1 hypothetical protein [Rhodobacterales bacterium HKCCD4356]NNV12740.1 hypothetical protein [Roseobacter sp. HKCCD7357]NNV16684.1 hypothetical protein [Roseobacter sp. HKCCD8768]NNV26684.1 hypothetical protein [Roseobacter sp. HKCCD8192]NNV30403.1 hypothetical protein [Roseobacter sp. HKCCD9061]
MERALRLEEFGTPSSKGLSEVKVELPDADLEALKLDAFKEGYRNGWDDCITAEKQNRSRIGEDLSQTLKNLTLTYDDARAQVLTAFQPLFNGIVEQMLPAIVAEALVPTVRAELDEILGDLPDGSCELIAAPSICPTLETFVANSVSVDLTVLPDASYSEGHVTLRFGTELREINLDAASARIAEAIRDFSDTATDQTDI